MDSLRELSMKHGVRYYDFTDAFYKIVAEQNNVIFTDKIHLTPFANNLLAKFIAKEILYDSPPTIEPR